MVWYNPFSWFGNEVELAPPDASDRGFVVQEQDLMDTDPKKRAASREIFQKNYQNLYNQMDEKWRPYLLEMAKNATGQSIIANMPSNVRVNLNPSVSELDPRAGAAYSSDSNELLLFPIGKDGKTGGSGNADPYMCLVHECRHAMQDYLGYSGTNGSADPKSAAINGMLIEADAHSVANVEGTIFSVFGTAKPSQDQIRAFMKKDLLREKVPPEVLARMSAADKRDFEKHHRDQPDIQLQSALKRTGGNLAKARQLMRQNEFKKYWKDGALGMAYESQTLKNMIVNEENGKGQKKPSKELSDQIYARIAKDHGISVDEVKKNLKVSPAFQACIDYMKANPNATPDQLEKRFDQIYDRARTVYDTDRDGEVSPDEYKKVAASLGSHSASAMANVQSGSTRSSGGFGAWFKSSWLGRALGFSSDTPAEAPGQAPVGQDSALASAPNSKDGKSGKIDALPGEKLSDRGPADATRTLANAGIRYRDQAGATKYPRGAERG